MGKEEQTIMVVKRELLFPTPADFFQGFSPADRIDYEERILANYEWMRRGKSDDSLPALNLNGIGSAESNPKFKQPIAYSIIYNSRLNKVFAYRRSSKQADYHESRLGGNWSWGFGGHIEQEDLSPDTNPIKDSMARELREEAGVKNIRSSRVLGYINDDTPHPDKTKVAVGQVHIGILYLVETDMETIYPADRESTLVQSMSLSELEEICASPEAKVDSWSRIALEPLRELLMPSK